MKLLREFFERPLRRVMPGDAPLGLIAGSGDLPQEIIRACHDAGRRCYVVAFEGETSAAILDNTPHGWFSTGAVGTWMKALKKEGVRELVLAGRVTRPSAESLKLDLHGTQLLSRIVTSHAQGDNALFSVIINYLEEQGFHVQGVDALFPHLLAPQGVLTDIVPDARTRSDILIGMRAAKALGTLDIGQAVVVQRGTVLGVEALEGTDELMRRCEKLRVDDKGGVLVKVQKPEQDTRIDLPTIGVQTVDNVYRYGLSGIAIETRATLIVDRPAVIARANALGLFVVGTSPEGHNESSE